MIRNIYLSRLCCSLGILTSLVNAGDLSPAGRWKTIDDKTGAPRGIVRIYAKNGEYFGKIEASFSAKDARAICDDCRDERRNQPVIGMVIMRHMRQHGDEYVGGDILDPDTGDVYRCRFRLIDGGIKMVLRGFIGFSVLGRSQTWLREK